MAKTSIARTLGDLALSAVLALVSIAATARGQDCHSGAVQTHDAYLYGRFEVRMQSVAGDGVVSSFFLYNVDVGCNWPAENNEIDIEMTGNRDDSVQFTTHHPNLASYTQITPVAFDPHAGLHTYAFEWTPGKVQWFVDGVLAYTQDQPYIAALQYPMRILMNLWAADSVSWVGVWTGAPMPASAHYDHVSYAAYTPGAGDTGTNNDFTHQWTDTFDTWDPNRWEASEFSSVGPFCTFLPQKVSVSGGQLHLEITEPMSLGADVPVTFEVNASSLTLLPGDGLYVNGTFNNWNGWSLPMSDVDGDGIWTRTVSITPGEHQYQFTKNGWDEVGPAPLGSSCDYAPCDEWANYGLKVSIGSDPITLPAVCWATCDQCPATYCAAEPRATCVDAPGKATLKVRDKLFSDSGDRVGLRISKMGATSFADFGDPVGGTSDYEICVYDESAGVPSLVWSGAAPAASTCTQGKPCWKRLGSASNPKGFLYKDSGLDPEGIQKILLKAGDAGKGKISVNGKGANLSLPGPVGAGYLAADSQVAVQVIKSDGPQCWSVGFRDVSRNDQEQFKARCKAGDGTGGCATTVAP